MLYISSRRNAYIKNIQDMRRKKGSWSNSIILEGAKLIEEHQKSKLKGTYVFYSSSYLEKEKLRLEEDAIEQIEIPDELMKYISNTSSAQGILLVSEKPVWGTYEDFLDVYKSKFGSSLSILCLENVQDPGNVGTMMRTAYALGFHGVVCIGNCADPYSEKSLRASMGAALHLPLYFAEKSSTIMEKSRGNEIQNIVTALEGYSLTEFTRNQALCLWIGNEGRGLQMQTLAGADELLSIPMPGGAESLNAATAASIVMYKLVEALL